ncbi:MAG: nickel/cobalt transporter, partial [Thermomicrobiales bacterium]
MIRIRHYPTIAIHRRARLLLLGPVIGLLALVASVLAPAATLAHPLDVYLMGSYVTVTPTQVEVEVDATPGVLLAPDVLAQIDTNGDGTLSDAESRAYVQTIVDALQLSVDGTPLTLSITKIEMPSYLNIQAGYGLIRISTSADLPASATAAGATASLAYVNGYTPTGAMYQVNTFTSGSTPIGLGTQDRSDDQASLDVLFAINGTVASSESTTTGSASSSATTSSASGWLGNLLAYLEHPDLSPAALAVAIGLAMVLGGIHALTPGHGKTLVAAYLVGNKGTVRHAAALGATVTSTHTLSVVAIGLLALFASHLLVPGILVPVLQVLSGLLVVVLATRLVRQRWAAFRLNRAGVAASALAHDSAMGVHHHGDGKLHSHAVPEGPLTARGLLAMGVSGGLVPCPEALGIMILAVGLNHIALGLGLIVAFSLGLAAVLIGLGILLVRSRTLLDRVGSRGGAIQRWLPLLSAAVVLVLGIGITVKGIGSIDGLGPASGT